MSSQRPLKIWITRAEPGAEATAARVRERGHTPLVAPLLAVRMVEDPQIDLSGVRALAFTSANGLRAFAGAVLQVGPGAEGAAGTGEHDGARVDILLRRLQRGVQVGQQRQADGVQPLGAVQRDDADRAVAVQGGKGHGGRGRAYDQIILTHEETLP